MEHKEQYQQELSVFAESFSMHGPGAVGDNLEKGRHTFLQKVQAVLLTWLMGDCPTAE